MPRLDIDLVANVARLQGDMAKAVGIVDRGFRDMKRAGDTVRNLLGVVGVGVGVGAFAHFVKSQIDATDALQDLSKRLNISTVDLAGLKLVAQQSGTDLEGLATAVKKLEVSMFNAGTNKELAATLRTLGVTAKDPKEALYQLADAFKSLGDSPERTAIAIKLMGKAGDAAIPALAAGGEELRRMMERGSALSGVTAENAKLADEFNDKLAELKTVAGSAGLALGTELMPWLLKMSKEMESAARISGGFGEALKNAFALNFNPQLFGITNDLSALQEKLEKGILTPTARTAVKAQIEFLKEQLAGSREALARQRKDLDAIFSEDMSGILAKVEGKTPQFKFPSVVAAPKGDAVDKDRLRAVAQFEELEKQVEALHKRGLDDRQKLDEQYAKDYANLNKARVAGVISDDRALGIERAALAAQYQQDLNELAVKQDTGSKLADQLAAEKANQRQALESRIVSIQEGLAAEQALEEEDYARKLSALTEANNTEVAATEEANARKLLSDEMYLTQRNALEAKHSLNTLLIERKQNQAVLDARIDVVQQSVNLLQLFAGKSKAAALATIALQKGLAIAMTVMNTQVAAMRALAELGPIAGAIAAAKIETLGSIAVGLIAAQGLAEASQVGSGGADIGSPVNPINTQSVSRDSVNLDLSPSAPSQEPITITVNLDGKPILETIQRASSDGRLVIDAHSVR